MGEIDQLAGVCKGQVWTSPLGNSWLVLRVLASGYVEVLASGMVERRLFIDVFTRCALVAAR